MLSVKNWTMHGEIHSTPLCSAVNHNRKRPACNAVWPAGKPAAFAKFPFHQAFSGYYAVLESQFEFAIRDL
jgi:hypothetical protein